MLDFLAGRHVMTLATCGPDGPWAAPVFYVSEEFDLHFVSSPRSRHILDAGAEVAAAVYEETGDWLAIRGLQICGALAPVPDADVPRVRALYERRFPFVIARTPATDLLRAAFKRVRWYRMRCRRLRMVDNARGFGFRQELDLGRPG
jgi:uncharacterized protein YhbP (UPF0306 family)